MLALLGLPMVYNSNYLQHLILVMLGNHVMKTKQYCIQTLFVP